MKLCYISSYPPTICGIGDYTESLAKELIKLDPTIEIHVIAEYEAKSSIERIKVHPTFDRKSYTSQEIIEAIRKIKPEIAHLQHSFGIFGADQRAISILEALRKLGSKVIVTFHTVHSRETVDFKVAGYDIEDYNRIISSYAHHIIVHTNSMKQVLARQGVNKDKISMIRIGAFKFGHVSRKDARRKLEIPENAKVMLAPGFIHRTKGTDIAIKVCKELAKITKDVELIIAGWIHPKEIDERNIKYAYNCLKMISKYGLNDKVIATKRNLSREELSTYLSASDLILLPYTQFNWSASGILKLAIGAKKPFIVTRIPKFEEVSEEISDEITAPPNDVKRMAKIAYRLLYDQEFREKIVSRIEEYAKKVSWTNIAKQHIEIYSEIIEEKANARRLPF